MSVTVPMCFTVQLELGVLQTVTCHDGSDECVCSDYITCARTRGTEKCTKKDKQPSDKNKQGYDNDNPDVKNNIEFPTCFKKLVKILRRQSRDSMCWVNATLGTLKCK